MAFWRKWRKKDASPTEPWLELDIPESEELHGSEEAEEAEDAPEVVDGLDESEEVQAAKALDSKLLSALAGRRSPLEAEAAVDQFIGLGWDVIAPELRAMALGRRMVVPSCFYEVISSYPRETAEELWSNREEMPWHLRMAFYMASQCNKEQAVDEVLAYWEELPDEAISLAIRFLATVKTTAALAKLGECLSCDNWTMAVKAAVALETAGAYDYLPQMKDIAAQGNDVLKASLTEIINRMEK
ncbi:MAG: hypothetical protein U0M15_07595 [Bacillota bacterium]|nr:hypothetical protein [Bacillota bacterium]